MVAVVCWPSRSGEDADLARAEDFEAMPLATAGAPEPEEEDEWGWSCRAIWEAVAAVEGMTWAVGMEVTLRTGWKGGLLPLLLLLQKSGGRKSTAAGSESEIRSHRGRWKESFVTYYIEVQKSKHFKTTF